MMKETGTDCIVRVRSEQRNADGEKQIIEARSKGRLSEREGVLYVLYTENMDENGTGESAEVRNLLKIEKSSAWAEIRKSGAVSWKMRFEQGRTERQMYVTPYGSLEICTETKAVAVKTEQKKTSLQLMYALLMEGEKQADCRLEIEIF